MSHIVSISYRGQQPGASSPVGSLALAQELPEQKQLTVADVATIIDDMHGVVDPCQNTRDNNSYLAIPLPGTNLKEHQQQYLQGKFSSTSSLENLAENFGGSCLVKQGKPIKLEIYAFWSNREIEDNYKLICPVGRVDNKRQVQSRFRLRIEVSNAAEIDFSYFVLERPGFQAFKKLEWIGGNIVDQYGRAKSIASPRWDRGGRLYWSENIRSGHIFAEFDTIYDQWTCTLPGVLTSGKRDYNATVTAIWAGDPVELALEVPDAGDEESAPCQEVLNDAEAVDLSVPSNDPPRSDAEPVDPADDGECYQVTITDYYHPCTGDYVRTGETQVPAPCDGFDDLDGPNPPPIYKEAFISVGDPAFASGTDCGDPCTADGYQEICCRPPDESLCVPACLQWYSKNQGGLLPPGGIDALKQQYGDNVAVVWVYPEDGDCGGHVDKLVLPTDPCVDPCDGVAQLVWSPGNPSGIAPGGSVELSVTGGNYPDLPVLWSIASGTGYTFSNGQQQITAGLTVTVYAGAVICGAAVINADDGCTEVTGSVVSTSAMSFDYQNPGENPDTILAGTAFETYRIKDFVGEPTWTISGASPAQVYFYDTENQQEVTGSSAWGIVVDADICDDIEFELTVTDSCDVIELDITGVSRGPLAFDYQYPGENPVSVAPDGGYEVYRVKDNIGGMVWTVSGAPSSQVYFLGTANLQTVESNSVAWGIVFASSLPVGTSITLTVADDCRYVELVIVTT